MYIYTVCIDHVVPQLTNPFVVPLMFSISLYMYTSDGMLMFYNPRNQLTQHGIP